MKIIVMLACAAMLSGCATGKMLQTEEGRQLILESPEIKAVLRSDTIVERTEKWCKLDPAFRFLARMALLTQRTYLPILSDEDSCG